MRRTCLDMVFKLAQADDRVVFIGSDLGAGTLDKMREAMPDRFFMEGVTEANIIGMAAGLAMDGYIPFVNTIATFITRRCYEQVAIDLCLHNLPVRLIGNGGGLVYAPLGPTHLAIEDIAIMRALPNMKIVAPSDADEMERFMSVSSDIKGPLYIRLAKGGDKVVSKAVNGFAIGRAILLRKPGRVLIVSTGVGTAQALGASDQLKNKGVTAGVLHLHTIKPLDESRIISLAKEVSAIITVEEHTLVGGLGSAVNDCLGDTLGRSAPPLLRLGIPDQFPEKYGTQEELLAYYGLDPLSISNAIISFLRQDGLKAA